MRHKTIFYLGLLTYFKKNYSLRRVLHSAVIGKNVDTVLKTVPAHVAAGRSFTSDAQIEFCGLLRELLRTHEQWFWYPYQPELLWGQDITPFQTEDEAYAFHEFAVQARAIEILANGKFFVKRELLVQAQQMSENGGLMGRANPNKSVQRIQLRRLALSLAQIHKSSLFVAKDLGGFSQPAQASGFISEASGARYIEKVGNSWRFREEVLREWKLLSGPPEESEELRLLYLVFGVGDTLMISKEHLHEYFATSSAGRAYKLPFPTAAKASEWLESNSGEQQFFIADDQHWFLQIPVFDAWQNEKLASSAATKVVEERAIVPELEELKLEPEQAEPIEAYPQEQMMVVETKSETQTKPRLKLPPPNFSDTAKTTGRKNRIRAMYALPETHGNRVYKEDWKAAIEATRTSPMTDAAVNSYFHSLKTAGFIQGDHVFQWNSAKLREYFGMPAEVAQVEKIVQSVQDPPAEQVPLLEDAPPLVLTEDFKQTEAEEFLQEAVPLVEETSSPKGNAPSHLEELEKLREDARIQATVAAEMARNAQSAQEVADRSERTFREAIQRAALVEIAKIHDYIKDLPQDLRELVVSALKDQL